MSEINSLKNSSLPGAVWPRLKAEELSGAHLEHVCPLGVAFVVMAAFFYAPVEGV